MVLAATALVIGTGCANVTVLSVSHAGDADGVTPTAIRVGGMGSLSGFVASSFALLPRNGLVAPSLRGVRML